MNRVSEIYPPNRVTLREVGLRDGLQLVKAWPDTQQKINWLKAERNAGIKHYEIGSFLPAKHFPQFVDICDLMETVDELEETY